MKKTFKLLMLALLSTFALASCEDVPAPYPNPNPDASQSGGSENGSSIYTSANLNEGWTSMAADGKGNPWSKENYYAQATGYQKWEGDSKSNKEVSGYFISPAFNTTASSGKVKISYDYCVAYANNDASFADHIKVYASNKYTEGDFVESDWQQLNWKATWTSSSWELKTEEIQLPEEFVNKENVHIAFWFYAPATKSSTFELKNFTVAEGEANSTGTPDVPDTPDTPSTSSKEAPLTAGQAMNASGQQYVKGYIVGYINGKSLGEEAVFGLPAADENQTNILIADNANENSTTNVVPVQLPAGDIRSALNLYANNGNLGKEVILYGSCEKYFGVGGLKSVTWAQINGKTVGKDPEGNNDQPTTSEDITVAEAMALISALANAGQTDTQYTVTGKIESITEISTQYGNATFVLEGGLTIFRCKDIGNVNFTDENRLKVGDEVKIKGYLKKYVKDDTVTPEVANGQLISINGNSEGSSTGNDNTGGNTGGTTTNDGSKVITFNVGEDKGNCTSSAPGSDQMSKNGITIAITKGALANTDNYRTYKNETMTISSSASNIVSVEITCTADDDAQYGPGNFTAESGQYTYSGKVGTWTGDAASVSLKATSAQVRATKIIVTIK